ncbi:efflux RND transporter periplasmic adaptor subunit [Alloalcanivorax marinus]|uniref:efflux RND transporter periplasmic adaptor subunit n=1 Tax=Alloalcanivorax marinus TaxID=1177169 RepID=UPI0021D0D863|nr:efflux RND transporter periplasmic adaptor subunit [Alloalcanivorax marinus]MCU5788647.1 RND family efflux transporter MFP subunit [Alloalcanivorax marinus]
MSKRIISKRMVIMLIILAVVFGLIFGFKAFVGMKMNEFFDNMPQPAAAVSTYEARPDSWALMLEAVGTVNAVNGVDVTSQVAGEVQKIEFESGDTVKKGDVLVTLESAADRAQLNALQATARLSRQEFDRYERLFKQGSISKSELDNRRAQRDQSMAQAQAQQEQLNYKTVRAPFDGRLGIRQVDLGQYLQPGTPVVSLTQLEPIFVDFSLPEQELSKVEQGLKVRVRLDAFPDQTFEGEISAIEPGVDAATRNVNIQARFENADRKLRPGMFAKVDIQLPQAEEVVVVPRTAISYAPYGNAVFVLQDADTGNNGEQATGQSDGEPQKIVKKRFVKLGRQRGDLVAVVDGLKPGEVVATSGLLKLRNDAKVTIENDVQPSADPTPTPGNS